MISAFVLLFFKNGITLGKRL